MPLELKYGGQLLIASASPRSVDVDTNAQYLNSKECFVIQVANSQYVVVRSITTFVRNTRQPSTHRQIIFATQLANLPDGIAKVFRISANVVQKQIHEKAPNSYYPQRGGLLPSRDHRGRVRPVRPREPIKLEKPPASVELPDTYVMEMVAHGLHDGKPYLEVGKTVMLRGLKDYKDVRIAFDTITAFEIPQ